MSLYIKLQLSFWTHRKTARLVSILGSDALWIMPKLWSYAAMNQPDGDFIRYSDLEFGSALGLAPSISEEAVQKIRNAICESGYMDIDGKLHDWEYWNGFHRMAHNRASKAAQVRWDRSRAPELPLGDRPVTSDPENEKQPARKMPVDISAVAASVMQLAFNRFWESYPRKVGKGAAWEQWLKLKPNMELQDRISQAVEAAKSSLDWTKENGEYVPHPATWLHQKRWDDTLRPAPAAIQSSGIPVRSVSEFEKLVKLVNSQIEEIRRKNESWCWQGGIRGLLKSEASDEIQRLRQTISETGRAVTRKPGSP